MSLFHDFDVPYTPSFTSESPLLPEAGEDDPKRSSHLLSDLRTFTSIILERTISRFSYNFIQKGPSQGNTIYMR
ncbi:hypothetical protein PIB30_026734, partial [Stylosanthes scabra]|nr:hypothetical protein [Stylosanthes scabra]